MKNTRLLNMQEIMKKANRLAQAEIATKPSSLAYIIHQVDDVHTELPALLQEPGISDADYDQLWDAHEHISKALAIMVRVKRRGETK